jgi:hypothetical protein
VTMGTTLARALHRPRPEPCCEPGRCQYGVSTIRYVQWLRERFRGEDLHEAASSCFDPHVTYEVGGACGVFGPTMEARWAILIGEVEAAERAGCRTPEEIARRLCPWAVDDATNERVR